MHGCHEALDYAEGVVDHLDQLVVHYALDTTLGLPSYFLLLTPMTNMGGSAEGAKMITFLEQPAKWAWALSMVVKSPVNLTT